jgi:hypothetical protein
MVVWPTSLVCRQTKGNQGLRLSSNRIITVIKERAPHRVSKEDKEKASEGAFAESHLTNTCYILETLAFSANGMCL